MFLSGIVLFMAYKQWPGLANTSKWAGLPVMAVSLILASFANDVKLLIATQGVLYAIGGAIIYWPTVIFTDEWFVKRKGLAFGVIFVPLPLPDSTNRILTSPGRHRNSRRNCPFPPVVPPSTLRFPHHPPHLGRHTPHRHPPTSLLHPPPDPHLPHLTTSTLLAHFPRLAVLLAPGNKPLPRSFGVFPTLHLPPYICKLVRLFIPHRVVVGCVVECNSCFLHHYHGLVD